jgi:hypothetical protein
MKRLLMGGLFSVCAGVGAYLMVSMKEMPPPAGNVLQPPTVAELPSPIPPAPVVLAQVVEITDLDPLLDPSAKSPTGSPFDADVVSLPLTAPTAPAVPDRIPPAAEDVPGEPGASFQPKRSVEEVTIGWYGSHQLPGQLVSTQFEIQAKSLPQDSIIPLDRFKLTDQAVAALWVANVPNMVLLKLEPLENKNLSREDFVSEIAKVLNTDEMERFQDLILKHAQMFESDSAHWFCPIIGSCDSY